MSITQAVNNFHEQANLQSNATFEWDGVPQVEKAMQGNERVGIQQIKGDARKHNHVRAVRNLLDVTPSMKEGMIQHYNRHCSTIRTIFVSSTN